MGSLHYLALPLVCRHITAKMSGRNHKLITLAFRHAGSAFADHHHITYSVHLLMSTPPTPYGRGRSHCATTQHCLHAKDCILWQAIPQKPWTADNVEAKMQSSLRRNCNLKPPSDVFPIHRN
ncbi:hypothetical protein COO60DRAFT_1514066 [Scenedesmus sp. NREL 46B-D3]|nr:hypothetical protein COO60DRAFT_1514066 [Scenedesmus sp. NREL 46B-D3]